MSPKNTAVRVSCRAWRLRCAVQAVGMVPGGSGNSFMTDFGLQQDARGAMDNIVCGRLAAIDALHVQYGCVRACARYAAAARPAAASGCGSERCAAWQ